MHKWNAFKKMCMTNQIILVVSRQNIGILWLWKQIVMWMLFLMMVKLFLWMRLKNLNQKAALEMTRKFHFLFNQRFKVPFMMLSACSHQTYFLNQFDIPQGSEIDVPFSLPFCSGRHFKGSECKLSVMLHNGNHYLWLRFPTLDVKIITDRCRLLNATAILRVIFPVSLRERNITKKL